MDAIPWMMSLLLWIQVPPPSAGLAAPDELRTASREIQEKEAKELAGLAQRLTGKGDSRMLRRFDGSSRRRGSWRGKPAGALARGGRCCMARGWPA